MPQFDLSGRNDTTGAISMGVGMQAARNPNGPSKPKHKPKPVRGTNNMDNPSKLAFYLAQAKAKNLTGKDASNFAYTRLKEYKRGGRVRGGL